MKDYGEEVQDKLKRVANGHVWREDELGIDYFAYEAGYHNGPECVNCGYSFCHHCQEEPEPCHAA